MVVFPESMNKLRADLHIHSVLSACGSLEMSPSKIVDEAVRKNLDIIALTDHNSAANCKVTMEIGKKKGLIVIPGIEVTVSEEFHVVTLFSDIKNAEILSDIIYNTLLPVEIDEDKMGFQLVVDSEENILRFEKRVLNQASLPVDVLIQKVEELNGVYFFAHIDKTYFSLISSLGFIPENMKDCIFELTREDTYGLKKIVKNSDAHFLKDIGHRYFYLEADKNIESVFENIRKGVFYYDA